MIGHQGHMKKIIYQDEISTKLNIDYDDGLLQKRKNDLHEANHKMRQYELHLKDEKLYNSINVKIQTNQ